MRGFGFSRRRKNKAGRGRRPTWQDNMPSWNSGPVSGRFLHIPEIDRWRAVPFDMAPAPEREAVLERVKQLTESLEGAIDEGTGASLDLLIESWAGTWIATVESEYVDHCAVISVHRGQAQQWLTETTATARHQREELDRCRSDYLACRQRLTGEPAQSAMPGTPSAMTVVQDPQYGGGPGDPGALAADGTGPAPGASVPGTEPVTARDWAAPHLVADRSRVGLIFGGLLVLAGALTDTVAFKNTLELILTQESERVSLLMASGATSMALVAAGSLGVALAIRRRGRHRPPRHRASRIPLVGSLIVWLGLGLAMFLVRWRDHAVGPTVFGGTSSSAPAQPTILIALFFLAIYLISGACTMFEAERLYNPEYFAFRRLRKQYHKQAKVVAKADAEADRARAALDLHDGELDREDQRRVAAIANRKALAAEAANYARIVMARMLRDPAKTGITETGPVPEMPTTPGAESGSGAAGGWPHAGVSGTA